ncbi:hypothetical protein W97_06980 [Coniosporium apollinis CBS 100218]|uniref:HECT-type E3 ubiquitin transferase n=1 Tax=Coniosporium apollinis (strain CBS 100218) TaxID=1168221 RepID=R7Z0F2_CONA1|nr:uncharacterized protein W97_06980 [Coniosporium apollinis CBS 100218]EON67612.1 hypothetical protein W97_06980 [Coniosporium apollinis CBS 100218]
MPSWSSRILHGTPQPASSLERNPTATTYYSPNAAFPTLHSPSRNPPQPQPKPAKARQHARSISHPFPGLFSKKKSSGNLSRAFDQDATGDDGHTADPDGSAFDTMPRGNAPNKAEDADLETGKCMTCDSKVRWPKNLNVFRCAACLMINDLEPASLCNAASIGQDQQSATQPASRSGAHTRPVLTRRGQLEPTVITTSTDRQAALPLSVETARRIIDKCLTDYLQARIARPELSHSPSRRPSADPNTLENQLSTSARPLPGPQRLQHKPNFAPDTPPISLSPPALEDDRNVFDAALAPSPKALPSPTRRRPAGIPLPSPAPAEHIDARTNTPARPTRKPPPPPIQRPGTATESTCSAGPSWDNHGARPIPSPGLPLEPSPRLTAEQIEQRRRHDSIKIVFKPLEDHIISSFGSFDCLNSSFSTARPSNGGRTRSEGSATIAAPAVELSQSERPGIPFSELDAKTLLLGDFAENGSWWSGLERNRSDKTFHRRGLTVNNPRRTVTSRSPCIAWSDLALWYDTILRAGHSWFDKLSIVKASLSDTEIERLNEAELHSISEEITEARIHAQRTLLKVTENLLKRPGRPLQEPEHIRFLLIILSNPLLYPSNATRFALGPEGQENYHRAALDQSKSSGSPGRSPSQRQPNSAKRDVGQHSGIVKRILGLMANLPNECHRHLITWFSRLEENHFRRLVDLVGSFVTYRLTRQQGRNRSHSQTLGGTLVPDLTSMGPSGTSAQLHAALGFPSALKKADDGKPEPMVYSDDWQLKVASKVMALLFAANNIYFNKRSDPVKLPPSVAGQPSAGLAACQRARSHGQLLPTSGFYNTLLDYSDLIGDFEAWESRRGRFSFCQYPFFLSIGAKIRIMEHDARRQMENKAREAFFDSIMSSRQVEQHFHLRVRRECMVDDSLRRISEVVGGGQEEIKKGLRVQFVGEEGVDAGGLRKEWFLLLVRDIFDPNHGMFVYDEDSHFCYFNPNSFETSDQYFLVGALLGLAIYNSTILDVALPPFAFKKLLASAPNSTTAVPSVRQPLHYTLEDLAEFRPALARGLRALLDHDGDVEMDFCRDFVADVERYGAVTQVPLCPNGAKRPVTNENRQEFVDLYVRYLLDTSVSRQFEPFKRGFFTVCGGNALSLFRPEEIELLVRGSDEPLDVASIKAVAVYENWRDASNHKIPHPEETEPVIRWFWEFFGAADAKDQRKILSFITGSDRIPAVGATNLVIKITCLGEDCERFPVARTCFDMVQLYRYKSRRKLVEKLWRAVCESEGFGLK